MRCFWIESKIISMGRFFSSNFFIYIHNETNKSLNAVISNQIRMAYMGKKAKGVSNYSNLYEICKAIYVFLPIPIYIYNTYIYK